MGDRTLWRRTIVGVIIIFVVATVAARSAEEQLTIFAESFMDRWGELGLALGVLLFDISPIPLLNEFFLFLAYSGGMAPPRILLIAGSASVLAGSVGYGLGFTLNRIVPVQAWAAQRKPEVVAWIQKHGGKGVAVAAVLPIPYSVSSWTAGAFGVPYSQVAAASLLRVPKTAFYLWVIVQGWTLGGG